MIGENNSSLRFLQLLCKKIIMILRKIFTIIIASVLSNALLGQLLQSGTYSETHVPPNSFISIFGAHSFTDMGLQKSIIHTDRSESKSYVIFAGENSSWNGASSDGYVNGAVKVFTDKPFLLPVGDGDYYQPIGASRAKELSAEFINSDPIEEISDKNGPLLSEGALSRLGYWNVIGKSPTDLILTWNENTEVDRLTGDDLSKLTIVAYDGNEWIAIPSTIDEKAINFSHSDLKTSNRNSDLLRGSIRTLDRIVPSKYKYFTLGVLSDDAGNNGDIQMSMYPNPAVENNSVYIDYQFSSNGGEVMISSLNNDNVYSSTINSKNGKLKISTDDLESGVYWVLLKDNNGKKVFKKLILLHGNSVAR